MSVCKTGKGKKLEWWDDPKNLPKIIEMFEDGDIMIFPSSATKHEKERQDRETAKFFAEYRAARRSHSTIPQVAYA